MIRVIRKTVKVHGKDLSETDLQRTRQVILKFKLNPSRTLYGLRWANLRLHNLLDGVEGYLGTTLTPIASYAFPTATPITVNLPWYSFLGQLNCYTRRVFFIRLKTTNCRDPK